MRKAFLFLLCLLLLSAACVPQSAPAGTDSGKRIIVTTIYPVYDWTREIIGETDSVSLILLQDSGTDLHSFQPSAEDIVTLCSCDLLIYVGGESDRWVDDALQNAVDPDHVSVSLMKLLGDAAREEELLPGMQADAEKESSESELDEHVWLSLKNAAYFCEKIASYLSELDPANAGRYEANASDYITRLKDLDEQYESAVAEAKHPVMLFGDRYPFAYLAADYDIGCWAAFSGCSAETEASFETIVFLARKLNEEDLPAILKLESSDGSVAEAIRSASNRQSVRILTLDSMQSAGSADLIDGPSYLDRMRSNLEVLKEALN